MLSQIAFGSGESEDSRTPALGMRGLVFQDSEPYTDMRRGVSGVQRWLELLKQMADLAACPRVSFNRPQDRKPRVIKKTNKLTQTRIRERCCPVECTVISKLSGSMPPRTRSHWPCAPTEPLNEGGATQELNV